MAVKMHQSSLGSLGYLTQWEMGVADCREHGHSHFWLSVTNYSVLLTVLVNKRKTPALEKTTFKFLWGKQAIHKFKNRLYSKVDQKMQRWKKRFRQAGSGCVLDRGPRQDSCCGDI